MLNLSNHELKNLIFDILSINIAVAKKFGSNKEVMKNTKVRLIGLARNYLMKSINITENLNIDKYKLETFIHQQIESWYSDININKISRVLYDRRLEMPEEIYLKKKWKTTLSRLRPKKNQVKINASEKIYNIYALSFLIFISICSINFILSNENIIDWHLLEFTKTEQNAMFFESALLTVYFLTELYQQNLMTHKNTSKYIDNAIDSFYLSYGLSKIGYLYPILFLKILALNPFVKVNKAAHIGTQLGLEIIWNTLNLHHNLRPNSTNKKFQRFLNQMKVNSLNSDQIREVGSKRQANRNRSLSITYIPTPSETFSQNQTSPSAHPSYYSDERDSSCIKIYQHDKPVYVKLSKSSKRRHKNDIEEIENSLLEDNLNSCTFRNTGYFKLELDRGILEGSYTINDEGDGKFYILEVECWSSLALQNNQMP